MLGVRGRAWRRCPHASLRGIYGDQQIAHYGGHRLICTDCGRLLDGPVSLAEGYRVAIDDLEKLVDEAYPLINEGIPDPARSVEEQRAWSLGAKRWLDSHHALVELVYRSRFRDRLNIPEKKEEQ